jgi:hypothetical protein
MIYPILGMHKSGTSMLAGTLHESGIPMFDGDPPTPKEYPKYEDETISAITKDVLGIPPTANTHSLWTPKPIGSEFHVKAATAHLQSRNHVREWGFKMPSVTLCWHEFWRPILETIQPGEVQPIGIFRSPFWVWRHYKTNQGAPDSEIFHAWKTYNQILLELDIPVFQYADFILPETIELLEGLLYRPIENTFVAKNHKLPTGIVGEYRKAVPDDVEELYSELISKKEAQFTAF